MKLWPACSWVWSSLQLLGFCIVVWSLNLCWTVCIVGLPVFCEQCHVRLPASCRWCLICVTVFCGWCRLWEPVLCRRCLIGFCAFWGWCLVVLPACGWCRGGMFGKVETVTLGCLANFWLHRLGDVIVVAEPGWGSQSSLEESTSHMNIQTHKKHTQGQHSNWYWIVILPTLLLAWTVSKLMRNELISDKNEMIRKKIILFVFLKC